MRMNKPLEGPFAVIDILGFKHSIMHPPWLKNSNRLLSVFDNAFILASEKMNEKIRIAQRKNSKLGLIKYLLCSDSIWMYQEKGHVRYDNITSKAECMKQIIQVLAHAIAICAKENVYLRGSISYGEFSIYKNNGTPFGPAILEAIEYESAQSWIGACLTESASKIYFDALQKNQRQNKDKKKKFNYCVQYDVPMKNGINIKPSKVAVRWPKCLGHAENLFPENRLNHILANEFAEFCMSAKINEDGSICPNQRTTFN